MKNMVKIIHAILLLSLFLNSCSSAKSKQKLVFSNDQGMVTVSGLTIQLLTNEGSPVANTQVVAAPDENGVLFLVVPPADSILLPKLEYIKFSQSPGLNSTLIVESVLQSPITTYVDDVDGSSLTKETKVPPGVLDEFWSSPGWSQFVESAHSVCETLSVKGYLIQIGQITYDVGITIVSLMSLKHLLYKIPEYFAGFAGVGITEGFIEVCLAATGDPVGLKKLTVITNDDLKMTFVMTDEMGSMDSIVERLQSQNSSSNEQVISTSTVESALAIPPTSTVEPTIAPAATNSPQATKLLLNKNYYCRTGPDSAYPDVTGFFSGTELPVIGQYNGWYLVDLTGAGVKSKFTSCWVGGGDIVGGDLSAIPIVQPSDPPDSGSSNNKQKKPNQPSSNYP